MFLLNASIMLHNRFCANSDKYHKNMKNVKHLAATAANKSSTLTYKQQLGLSNNTLDNMRMSSKWIHSQAEHCTSKNNNKPVC